MNSIQIHDLHKHYGQVQALDGLQLEVQKGSIYGFLGPNGAGKTTTLRILAGLARADSGKVTIDGDAEVAVNHPSNHIGYLPEEPAFYAWMTPREFLDYVGEIFHLDAKTRKARGSELIELSGLKEAQKRKIGGFSHGMRQRLGFAQAMMNQPDVLLLDEPVSALDPAGRKEILELIQSLRGRCTILMSTHILEDVERVCDTIGIIDKGRMVIQAERGELLNRYAVSAVDVELTNGSAAKIEEIKSAFERIEGVSSVGIEQNLLHIAAQDVQPILPRLMQMIMAQGIQVNKIEVVRPSLEDIFMQLTGEGRVEA